MRQDLVVVVFLLFVSNQMFCSRQSTKGTPLKTNMSPENQWLVQMYSLLK